MIPSLSFADRLGSLRSGAEVMLSTQGVQVNPSGVQSGAFNIAGGTITGNYGQYWKGTGGSSNSFLYPYFTSLPRSGGFGPQPQDGFLYFQGNRHSNISAPFGIYAGTVQPTNVNSSPIPSTEYGDVIGISLSPGNKSFAIGTGFSSYAAINDSSTTLAGNLVLTAYDCSGNTNSGKLTVDANGLVSCADDISGGGGGGGTTIWSKKDGASLDTAVSTINFLTGGGLTATSAPGGQINIGLSASSTYFLGLGVAATTYATQAIVIQSTTQLNSQFANYATTQTTLNLSNTFANYVTTGGADARYLQTTVAATTYQTIQNVLTSTTQLNSQFANYATTQTTLNLSNTFANYATTQTALNITNTFNNYNSTGANNAIFLRTTVAATTYALQTVVTQSTTQLNSQFANYATTQTTLNLSNTFANYATTQTTLNISNTFNNYYSSGQAQNLFNLKTVDATTYLTISSAAATYPPYVAFDAGSNITLTPVGNHLQISATGGGGGSGTTIMFREEGSDVVASSTLNVVGSNATITDVSGVATLTITGGSGSGFDIYPASNTIWANVGIVASTLTTTSTVTHSNIGTLTFQENTQLIMPRAMNNSTYTAKGSLSYDMTSDQVEVGTGTFARPLAGHTTTTIFLTTGTYTPHARMVTVKVTLVGTGGSTGNCAGTDSTVGGGGGGATAIKTFTRMQIGASQAVNIPAAPTAGVVGSSATFGSFLVAGPGGRALEGTAATVAISSIPGQGGIATGGDINLTGQDGTPGIIVTTAIGIGGTGGASYLGGGAFGGRMDVVGRAGTGYGGGAGGCHAATATDRAGASGGPGVAIIEEYLN